MTRCVLNLAVVPLLIASTTVLQAQGFNDPVVCQHTTEPAYSWVLNIGVDGKPDQFTFVPRDSAMTGANGDYAGTCADDECTAEKPTKTGDTTYRTVLRVDRMAGIAEITQYSDNGDVWSRWQATCQQQDGNSDQESTRVLTR